MTAASIDATPADEPIASTASVKTDPRKILTPAELKAFSQQSNWAGLLQFSGHLFCLGLSGCLWLTFAGANGLIAVPALLVYGVSLATMFAPVHECVHRTAFASNRLNDWVGWIAGCLSFYNSTFFRRYHKWHHRFTRVPDKDPELTDLIPTCWQDYLLHISGLPWWVDKLKGYTKIASGKVEEYAFLQPSAYADVIQSTRLQLGVYVSIFLVSTFLGHPEFLLMNWVLPLAIGQPILRCILIAEHTHCSSDTNPLTNTRTTLTLWPIRFLMWNMPFHAEHHLHLSIPFHQLPRVHQRLQQHFTHVEAGYIRVNRKIVAALQ